jgi:hypothetical protein
MCLLGYRRHIRLYHNEERGGGVFPRPEGRALHAAILVPDPSQVGLMHLLLSTTPEGFAAAAGRLAAEQHIWTWPQATPTPDPGVQRVELHVGDATRALRPGQVRDIIAVLTEG